MGGCEVGEVMSGGASGSVVLCGAVCEASVMFERPVMFERSVVVCEGAVLAVVGCGVALVVSEDCRAVLGAVSGAVLGAVLGVVLGTVSGAVSGAMEGCEEVEGLLCVYLCVLEDLKPATGINSAAEHTRPDRGIIRFSSASSTCWVREIHFLQDSSG